MKVRAVPFLVLGCLLVVGSVVWTGCSREPAPPPPQPAKLPPPQEKGVTRTLVEEMSGYRAAQQGQMMKEKIKAISAEHDADMSAVLDEGARASAPANK